MFVSSLHSQALDLAASGLGFTPISATSIGSVNSLQGRPYFVVPSFVLPRVSSVAPLPRVSWQGFSPLVPFSLPNVPVVSQGVSPIPLKLVSPIVSGKFVELSKLLSSNIVQTQLDLDPQLFFNGWLVLTSMCKKPKLRLDDIGSWLEAFSVNCLVLTSHFPHCWKDLLLYQLLILRTYGQFTGWVWLAYDQASWKHAAVTN